MLFFWQAIEGFEMQNKTRKPADKFGSEQVRTKKSKFTTKKSCFESKHTWRNSELSCFTYHIENSYE